jgi:predicted anti-sigma-YlaC factor YlaD
MTCREMIDFLADYFDGDLPIEARRRFEQHLGECSQCRRYLSQYRTAVDLARLGDDPPSPLPPDLIKAIVDAASRK